MKIRKLAMVLFAGFMLSGFDTADLYEPRELEALKKITPTGSAFSQQLVREYNVFANFLYDNGFDFSDSVHFARKGLSVASGEEVFPEPVVDWDVRKEHIAELTNGRARLMRAISSGARLMAPQKSAVAQVRYDCWIEESEEGNHENDCKRQFEDLLPQLEQAAGNVNIADRYRDQNQRQPKPQAPLSPYPEPVGYDNTATSASDEPLDIAEALYLIFFDFDSANIRAEAQSVIDTLANEIRPLNLSAISIIGHADTTGSEQYNKRLGLRRAKSVKDGLIKRGIDPAIISIDTRGESELLVPTSDGVREPANRRSVITFTE